MDARLRSIAALAAGQHSVVSLDQVRDLGVPRQTLERWVKSEVLRRLGTRSFLMGGAELTWLGRLTADWFDSGGTAFIAGRSAAVLMHLDGFGGEPRELLTTRDGRGRQKGGIVRSTRQPIPRSDVQRISGLWVVRAERLILDAPIFGFSRAEIENAIDSSVRLRLVSEQRLRKRVAEHSWQGIRGGTLLVEAMVDTGGESRLERWLLALCREAGLPRPATQKVFRDGGRALARVDAEFAGGLLVEVEGNEFHSTRQQRQADEERRTELTLRGRRLIAFMYDDVRYRPAWVASKIREALLQAA